MPDFVREIASISELVPDRKNPRVAASPDTERDTYLAMAKSLGAKLIALASDIVARGGLNPATVFIVIRGDSDQLIVLDGNRRLTAIRALEQPSLVESALSSGHFKRLRALSEAYTSGKEGLPIEEAPCVVFSSRAQANDWIELIHEGERGGAGPVPWSAQQKARHRANNTDSKDYHMQVLDFVMREGEVSDDSRQRYEAGKYPVSTLERTLSTPEVRHQLGIETASGEVSTRYPKGEVLKGLNKLVDEIGSGETKVDRVFTKDKRIKYVESFGSSHLPNPTQKGEVSFALDEAPTPQANASQQSRNGSRDRQHSSKRTRIVPSSFSVEIDSSRINDIYIELKRRLELGSTANAIGVLLRVFIELSVDEYIEREGVTVSVSKQLAPKVKEVATYMEKNGVMSHKQLVPVRQAVKKAEDGSGTLVTTLNGFIHNRDYTPTAADLTAMWDRLSTFIEKLWE